VLRTYAKHFWLEMTVLARKFQDLSVERDLIQDAPVKQTGLVYSAFVDD
jgi:hypothetical protein